MAGLEPRGARVDPALLATNLGHQPPLIQPSDACGFVAVAGRLHAGTEFNTVGAQYHWLRRIEIQFVSKDTARLQSRVHRADWLCCELEGPELALAIDLDCTGEEGAICCKKFADPFDGLKGKLASAHKDCPRRGLPIENGASDLVLEQ